MAKKSTTKKTKFQTEVFNPKAPTYVRRSFRGSGREWLPGQSFDWGNLSISQRRVSQLFQQRYLTHEEPEFTPEDEAADKAIDETNKGDLQGDPEEKQPDETAGGPKIVSKPGGWYDVVDAEGKVLNEKSLRQPDAEELLAGILNKQ